MSFSSKSNSFHKRTYISSLKALMTPAIRKAKAKDFLEIWNKLRKQSKSQNIKKSNTTNINKKNINHSNLNLNSISIINYSFVTGKPSNKSFYTNKSNSNKNFKIEVEEDEEKSNKMTRKKKFHLYDKFILQKLIKDSKIEEAQNKKILDEYNQMHQPVINQKSLDICSRSKTLSKPLHKRLSEIEKKHIEKLNKIKLDIKKEKDDKEKGNFDNCLNNSNSNKRRLNRSFSQWLNENAKWESKRKEKIIKMKKILIENDSYSNETFNQPEINKKSERIFKEKIIDKGGQKDFSSRLYNSFFVYKEKKRQLIKKYAHSFKPKINKDHRLIKNKIFIFEEDSHQ